MADELTPLDISQDPHVRRLVEEVQAANQPRILRIDDRDVALLVPTRPTRVRRSTPTSADDPLWRIVGLGHTDSPGTVSRDVDRHLAEAYMPPRE